MVDFLPPVSLTGAIFWLWPLLVLGVFGLLLVALTWLGVGTPSALKTFQGALRSHGYVEQGGGYRRLEDRLPEGLKKSIKGLDLPRSLAITHSTDSPVQFLARSIAMGFLLFALLLGMDGLGFAKGGGGWLFSPLLPLLIGAVTVIFLVSRLQRQARDICRRIDEGVLTLMPLLAAAVAAPGVTTADALRVLSEGLADLTLFNLLNEDHWRSYMPGVSAAASTSEIYFALGSFFKAPNFEAMAEAIDSARTSGLPEGEAINQQAALLYSQRAADLRREANSKRLAAAVVTIFMLLILLSIFGYPLASAVSQI